MRDKALGRLTSLLSGSDDATLAMASMIAQQTSRYEETLASARERWAGLGRVGGQRSVDAPEFTKEAALHVQRLSEGLARLAAQLRGEP